MAGGFESPLIDSEVGTDTNTDKNFKIMLDFLIYSVYIKVLNEVVF